VIRQISHLPPLSQCPSASCHRCGCQRRRAGAAARTRWRLPRDEETDADGGEDGGAGELGEGDGGGDVAAAAAAHPAGNRRGAARYRGGAVGRYESFSR
jgi:hypothetical protein